MTDFDVKHYCHYIDANNIICNKFDKSFHNYCDEHKLLNRNPEKDYGKMKLLVSQNITEKMLDFSNTDGRANKLIKLNIVIESLSESKWILSTSDKLKNTLLERLLAFTCEYNSDCLSGNEHIWKNFDIEHWKRELFPDIFGNNVNKQEKTNDIINDVAMNDDYIKLLKDDEIYIEI